MGADYATPAANSLDTDEPICGQADQNQGFEAKKSPLQSKGQRETSIHQPSIDGERQSPLKTSLSTEDKTLNQLVRAHFISK